MSDHGLCCDERWQLNQSDDAEIRAESDGFTLYTMYGGDWRLVAYITHCPWCGTELDKGAEGVEEPEGAATSGDLERDDATAVFGPRLFALWTDHDEGDDWPNMAPCSVEVSSIQPGRPLVAVGGGRMLLRWVGTEGDCTDAMNRMHELGWDAWLAEWRDKASPWLSRDCKPGKS